MEGEVKAVLSCSQYTEGGWGCRARSVFFFPVIALLLVFSLVIPSQVSAENRYINSIFELSLEDVLKIQVRPTPQQGVGFAYSPFSIIQTPNGYLYGREAQINALTIIPGISIITREEGEILLARESRGHLGSQRIGVIIGDEEKPSQLTRRGISLKSLQKRGVALIEAIRGNAARLYGHGEFDLIIRITPEEAEEETYQANLTEEVRI